VAVGWQTVSGMDRSLNRLTLADGTVKTYQFSLKDEKLQMVLKIGAVQSSGVDRIETDPRYAAGSGEARNPQPLNREPGTVEPPARVFTWDTATRRIVADGDWTYDIQADEKNPEAFAAIGRKNAAGQSEFWHEDSAKGMETVQGLDGVKRVTSWFTSGPASGKVRKIEEAVNGKNAITYRAIFDENGDLVRKISNSTTIWTYDKAPEGVVLFEIQAGSLSWKNFQNYMKQISKQDFYTKMIRTIKQDDGCSVVTIIDRGIEVTCALDAENRVLGFKHLDD